MRAYQYHGCPILGKWPPFITCFAVRLFDALTAFRSPPYFLSCGMGPLAAWASLVTRAACGRHWHTIVWALTASRWAGVTVRPGCADECYEKRHCATPILHGLLEQGLPTLAYITIHICSSSTQLTSRYDKNAIHFQTHIHCPSRPLICARLVSHGLPCEWTSTIPGII